MLEQDWGGLLDYITHPMKAHTLEEIRDMFDRLRAADSAKDAEILRLRETVRSAAKYLGTLHNRITHKDQVFMNVLNELCEALKPDGERG